MRTLFALSALCLSLGCGVLRPNAQAPADAAAHWPQWRGPQGNGVAAQANPPTEWGEGQNVRWKVEVPGKGHASPIVWGDQVVVLTAVPAPDAAAPTIEGESWRRGFRPAGDMQFIVISYDRKSGAERWRRVVRQATPHEGTHLDATWASGSALTDGRRIYAYFGSFGLYCLDMAGEPVWEVDLGDMQTRASFGEGASPALYGNTLVINWDHEGPSFIVALDKRTGKELWRQERDERTSWGTPLIVEVDGRPQVITNGTTRMRGYDLETGETVWQSGGMTTNTIPTPLFEDGVAFMTSGFRGNALHAIRLAGASGELTDTDAVLWTYERDTPYVPSPLLYGGRLYFLKSNNGILTCLDSKTGEVVYGPQRLEGVKGFYASPVGAAGRVYLAGREGVTLVLKEGPEFEVLAANSLDDGFDASPAAVGDALYLRGRQHLYCIAAD